MKIKNPKLAGATIRVGDGEVTGDGNGVFDVPDKIAEQFLATGRWAPAKKGAAPPKAAPTPPPADTEDDGTSAAGDDNGDTEEVDLDALTKAELIALAEEQGVDVDPHSLKAEIKDALEAALGG